MRPVLLAVALVFGLSALSGCDSKPTTPSDVGIKPDDSPVGSAQPAKTGVGRIPKQ